MKTLKHIWNLYLNLDKVIYKWLKPKKAPISELYSYDEWISIIENCETDDDTINVDKLIQPIKRRYPLMTLHAIYYILNRKRQEIYHKTCQN